MALPKLFSLSLCNSQGAPRHLWACAAARLRQLPLGGSRPSPACLMASCSLREILCAHASHRPCLEFSRLQTSEVHSASSKQNLKSLVVLTPKEALPCSGRLASELTGTEFCSCRRLHRGSRPAAHLPLSLSGDQQGERHAGGSPGAQVPPWAPTNGCPSHQARGAATRSHRAPRKQEYRSASSPGGFPPADARPGLGSSPSGLSHCS